MSHRRPTAIDLFCGVGGMSLGFEQAGFDVLAAFDSELFNIRTHALNFPDVRARVADLSRGTARELRSISKLGRRKIDVVFGGPPCQGFSVGGRHDVNDERNQLIFDFARLVSEFRPNYFVMENVKGLMHARSRPTLDKFLSKIRRSGYEIVEPIRVLNAADFGVPQRRLRTIILGFMKGVDEPEYPMPNEFAKQTGQGTWPVVRDAIADLRGIDEDDTLFENDIYESELPKATSEYARIMRGELSCEYDRSNRTSVVHRRLTGCLRTRHSVNVVDRFRATLPGESEPVSRYIRLAWDEVAPTLRAGTGKDRGSHTAPRPIHPLSPRCITSREAARLHSFPDWFQFHGTRWHDFRQIGNSVPPLLARAVASKIAQTASR
ncbi:DNA cytosine methyltransferase [Bremerella cremea]|uniref:Cytosine-specific methyltransferase n=1 Tax=Blastopirellula marina TaxID=124 RepID=A0A2S8FUZ9_9BACT|nr:DNA (cytosine-5-)-methyltransferase [Blastopirellula marina]RCS48557.1 DNA cytosine methyltransferase [Bremerella cremea]